MPGAERDVIATTAAQLQILPDKIDNVDRTAHCVLGIKRIVV
jgi:hypothetical protein